MFARQPDWYPSEYGIAKLKPCKTTKRFYILFGFLLHLNLIFIPFDVG